MAAVSIPPGLASQPPQAPDGTAKIMRAAQDFEAVLLGEMLRSLAKSLSAVPGETTDAGADDYQYLGSEGLASALAARGGLGIGQMIADNLMRTQPVKPDP